MDKEDIMDYVMYNPENTNPAVLRDMLDQYDSGGALPDPQTTDGTYVLTQTVSSGEATNSWESAGESGGNAPYSFSKEHVVLFKDLEFTSVNDMPEGWVYQPPDVEQGLPANVWANPGYGPYDSTDGLPKYADAITFSINDTALPMAETAPGQFYDSGDHNYGLETYNNGSAEEPEWYIGVGTTLPDGLTFPFTLSLEYDVESLTLSDVMVDKVNEAAQHTYIPTYVIETVQNSETYHVETVKTCAEILEEYEEFCATYWALSPDGELPIELTYTEDGRFLGKKFAIAYDVSENVVLLEKAPVCLNMTNNALDAGTSYYLSDGVAEADLETAHFTFSDADYFTTKEWIDYSTGYEDQGIWQYDNVKSVTVSLPTTDESITGYAEKSYVGYLGIIDEYGHRWLPFFTGYSCYEGRLRINGVSVIPQGTVTFNVKDVSGTAYTLFAGTLSVHVTMLRIS